MFKLNPQYRFPLMLAVALHLILIIMMIIRLPGHQVRLDGPVAERDVVRAVAINSAQVEKQVAAIKEQQQQAKQARVEQQRKLEQQAEQVKKVHEQAQLKLEQLKQQELATEKKIIQEKALALKMEKQRREKDKQQRLEKEKQKLQEALTQKQLQQERAQLQKKLMQQQLAAEQEQMAREQTAQAQGEIDRYAAQIKAAIENNLNTPSNYQKGQYCIYAVDVAPGGAVLNARMVKSSGNPAFDEAAQVAIMRTSPLPVPAEPALFEKFRHLRLTLNPYQSLQKDEL